MELTLVTRLWQGTSLVGEGQEPLLKGFVGLVIIALRTLSEAELGPQSEILVRTEHLN